MKGIIPRSKAKGFDICGVGNYYYIIRSDLGCYMQTSDLNEGSDISVFSLHPSCRNGEHYLAGCYASFIIIKGNSYRKVKNLTTDSGAEVRSLHPNCRGGDHYLSDKHYYYIIFQEKGTYRRTTSISKDSGAVEYNLHPNLRNSLYFWGVSHHMPSLARVLFVPFYAAYYTASSMVSQMQSSLYFLKPASEWGVEFCSSADFSKDACDRYSVHPDVLNFLPGGLSVTKGPSFGIWECIKTLTNDSNTPVAWEKKINKKVGYDKEKMTQITHNWKIAASVTAEPGFLAKLIAKAQFSVSAEYGGSHVSTERESWNQVTEVEEKFKIELKPNESLYVWQYKLGIGQEQVLFCRDLKFDDVPNPPTDVPLPPAQS